MALGLNYTSGGGGDIVPFCKYDARAGRFFRNDRSQDAAGNYSNESVDITSTFKAVFDMENIEVGYIKFGAGQAPEFMLGKLGDPMAQKPADPLFKQGVRLMIKLHQSCGGDVREVTGNSASFLKGVDDLHSAYEEGKAANPSQLPIVVLKSTIPITSGQGAKKSTNYQPVFEIAGWCPRPADLVHVPKGGARVASPSTAPSTGSTPVSAPKPLAAADANGFG